MKVFLIILAAVIWIAGSMWYLVGTWKIEKERKFAEKLRMEQLAMRYGYDPIKVQNHLIREKMYGEKID